MQHMSSFAFCTIADRTHSLSDPESCKVEMLQSTVTWIRLCARSISLVAKASTNEQED